MTFQTSSNDLLTVSPYLVDPNATGGRFTSIQDAMDAASSELSPTPSNPAVVLVKPGTYVESLTIPTGIVVEGIDKDSVFVNGLVTVSSGAGVQMVNLTVVRTSGDSFSVVDGTLTLRDCDVSTVAGQTFNLTTAAAKTIVVERSSFQGDGTSDLFDHDGAAATVIFNSSNSTYTYSTEAVFAGPNGTFTFTHVKDELTNAYVFNGDTLNFTVTNSQLNSNGDSVIRVADSGLTGSFNSFGNKITLLAFNRYFDSAATAVVPSFSSDEIIDPNGVTISPIVANTVRDLQWNTLTGSTTNDTGVFFSTPRTGFANAEVFQTCGYVNIVGVTSGDLFTTSSGIRSGAGGITIFGLIAGNRVGTSEYIGGSCLVTARFPGGIGTLVGQSFTLQDDAGTPATMAAVVVGSDIVIRITQTAADTWNYSGTFWLQRVTTDA